MICLQSDSIYQKLSKKHFSKILANIFDMCQIFWPNFFQIHEFEISARANQQIRSNPSYFCNFQYILDACDCLINSQRNLMSLIVHNCTVDVILKGWETTETRDPCSNPDMIYDISDICPQT